MLLFHTPLKHIPFLLTSPLITVMSMYYFVFNNWIGEHKIVKLRKKETKKKKDLASNPEKGHKNKPKTTWIKWIDTKWTIWYFQLCACVNAIYFAPLVTTSDRKKSNKSSKRGLSLKNGCVHARARAQLLNMLYNSTHLSVPYGECKLSPVHSIGDSDFLRVISWACWYYHPLLVLVNYLLCYVAIYIC